jgi:hypothetical protein
MEAYALIVASVRKEALGNVQMEALVQKAADGE